MSGGRPRVVTFEGIEGVGKSTQIALAAQWLERRAVPHVTTREPGGTPLAETIRNLVLNPRQEPLPARAELLLMFAARAVHLSNLIEPALADGRWVLCDRFTDATYAYQGAGRGMAQADIAGLEQLVQQGRQPDLTVLLDLPAQTGLHRAAGRGGAADRFESERLEFFERVRDGYLRRARAEPARFRIIDASASVERVHEQVVRVLEVLLATD